MEVKSKSMFVVSHKSLFTTPCHINSKKNANWFVLTLVLFECAFLPWDRIHPTDLPVFVLKFKKKNSYDLM